MKSFAKFLTGVALVAVLVIAYYIVSSRLYTDVSVRVIPARDRSADFARVQQDVDGGVYDGLQALDTIDNYYFVTFEVRTKNFSLFPAEWTQLSMRAVEGDVLLFAQDGGPKDVSAFGANSFSATLLTRSSSPWRSGWLEYYIFGRQHTLDVAPVQN